MWRNWNESDKPCSNPSYNQFLAPHFRLSRSKSCATFPVLQLGQEGMTRSDDAIIEISLKVGFLTLDQITEIRRLQKTLEKNRVPAALTDILLKKDFLSLEQMRLIHLAIREDQVREEEIAIGNELRRTGQVDPYKIREALDTQERLWKEGHAFPHLGELLVKLGAMTPDQFREFQRTQASNKDGRKKAGPGTSGEIPPVRLKTASRKREKLVLAVDGCRVQVRKAPIREGDKQSPSVAILDIDGLLDGHTYKAFEDFVHQLALKEGLPMIVLNCEKLEYVSSAGVGILASAVKLCRDNKGDFCLCAVSDRVKRVINLVGLQSMLRSYDREQNAVTSFQHL